MPPLYEPYGRTSEVGRSFFIIAAAVVAAVFAGFAAGAQPVLLVVPVLLVIPVIAWRRPEFTVLFLLGSATVIEELQYVVGDHKGAFTSNIPWWRTFTHGMILFPVEFFLLLVILVWVLKAGLEGTFGLPKTPVITALKFFWVFLIIGVGVGLSHGASIKFDFWETRSFIYLTVAFLLAAAFLRTRKALDAVLWTFILGSGFKAIQGTIIFFSYARKMIPRPEAILGHEEAFFFGIFITITVVLYMYGIRGRLRTVATCLLPFVVIADLANARRTAWLILATSVITVFVIGLSTLPHRRRFLRRALIVVAIVSVLYIPAYWNHDGTLAAPAQAVRSQIQPNERDASSDLYRQEENINLILNIKASGLLGKGFGIPIVYSSDITNISTIDPLIAYVPHNGVLWIWMRLGLQGEIAFWCLIAVSMVRACRLATSKDRRLALFGTLAASALVAYVIDGYEDTAFAEFRIAVAMGCLLGVMEAAIRLIKPDTADSDDALAVSREGLPGITSSLPDHWPAIGPAGPRER